MNDDGEDTGSERSLAVAFREMARIDGLLSANPSDTATFGRIVREIVTTFGWRIGSPWVIARAQNATDPR